MNFDNLIHYDLMTGFNRPILFVFRFLLIFAFDIGRIKIDRAHSCKKEFVGKHNRITKGEFLKLLSNGWATSVTSKGLGKLASVYSLIKGARGERRGDGAREMKKYFRKFDFFSFDVWTNVKQTRASELKQLNSTTATWFSNRKTNKPIARHQQNKHYKNGKTFHFY